MPSEPSFQSLSIFLVFHFPNRVFSALGVCIVFSRGHPSPPLYPVRNIPLHRWQWLWCKLGKKFNLLKRGRRQAAADLRRHMCLIGTCAAWRKMQGHTLCFLSHPLFSRFSARTRTHTPSFSLSHTHTHSHARTHALTPHIRM